MKNIVFVIAMVLMALPAVQAASEEENPDPTRLCEGKGPHVKLTIKIDGRTVQGSCQIGFKPVQPHALDQAAMNDPVVQNACKGKARGSAIVMNIKGKNVPGKCDLVFKSYRYKS